MSYTLLSGKEAAANEKLKLSNFIKSLDIHPVLAVVVVGDNPASAVYVKGKKKDCDECGITCKVFKFNERVEQDELVATISNLNNNDHIDGIIVQLPLPEHISADAVLNTISIEKDVDGFCAGNVGMLSIDNQIFVPCTPLGIITLLKYYNIDVAGKDCVVIGRSNIVGKPMAMLLTNLGATVTLCHSKTKNLARHTREADLIVCSVGKHKFLTADKVKEGAIVVDVGINRDKNGKLCGDVDFESVSKKVSAITPVPGGVGLMTRAALMDNVVRAYYLRRMT